MLRDNFTISLASCIRYYLSFIYIHIHVYISTHTYIHTYILDKEHKVERTRTPPRVILNSLMCIYKNSYSSARLNQYK